MYYTTIREASELHDSFFSPLDLGAHHVPFDLAEEEPYAVVPYTREQLNRMRRFSMVVPRVLSAGYMAMRCLKIDKWSFAECIPALGGEEALVRLPEKGYVMLALPGFTQHPDEWVTMRAAPLGLTARPLSLAEYLMAVMVAHYQCLGIPQEPRAVAYDPHTDRSVYVVCDKYAEVRFFHGPPRMYPCALGFESSLH